jgi:phage gp16-like protein
MAIASSTRAKIHIARQQLGMDDDTYRAMLQRVAGVDSSTRLTAVAAAKVLSEFERLGFRAKALKTKGKPHNFDQLPEMITKIEAQLADMGLPWSYADGIAKQMWGVQRMAWTRQPKQLKAIIAALSVEQEKRGLLADLEELMRTVGARDPKWQATLDALPDGWRRHRPTLRKLVNALTDASFAEDFNDVDV